MKDLIEKVAKVLESAPKETICNHGDGWVNLANLGVPMQMSGINAKELGFKNTKALFESMPDAFEIHNGYIKTAKVSYVRRLIDNTVLVEKNRETPVDNNSMRIRTSVSGNNDIIRSKYLPLEQWAYLRDINMFLERLSSMAQDEKWNFNNGKPAYPQYPILYSYIRYTFCRLQFQNKIVYSIDGEMAAFNTGLTDDRYEPIIALFKKNRPGSISDWVYYDFVIAGEDKGKIIINKFAEEILSATYTDNPSELIYDINMGAPVVDIDHVVIERIDRLPYEFIKRNAPYQFEIKDISTMDKTEKRAYFDSLREAVRKDYSAYRNMINRVRDAINLALKRVHWNYKNAVPMFYPKDNVMCLLLPLCLVDDSQEDIALVVKRTPASKYEGATILPLDWAYSDARVVARPNSEWLDAHRISGTNEAI